MCKACALLQDQPSVNGYLELVETWIKDTTSLVACSMKSGRVIGVAITRIDSHPEKTDVYNRAQIHEGSKLNSIMHLMNTVIQQTDPYEKFGQPEYFRIYLVCVHPSYQERDVEIALLDACVQVAKSLKFFAIGGIFTCGASQTKARSFGFTLFSEIRYNRWIVDDRVVFNDPGRGNYSAAFMGMLITVEDEQSQLSQDDTVVSLGKETSVKSMSAMTARMDGSVSSHRGTLKSVESKHL
ncbi:uncharacterized protein LOC143353711 [Halictus rubicundus]|uniref:uncharacterized protein LOC143353711 n=1 Tax=Halictus rubicundus TaxID=77578 RepID=UPI004035ACB5